MWLCGAGRVVQKLRLLLVVAVRIRTEVLVRRIWGADNQ